LLKNQKHLISFEDEFNKDATQHVKHLGIKLKVKETGSLLLDPNVTHPFVRVHIVDMNTSMYLAKDVPTRQGVCNKESVSLMDKDGKFTAKPVDFLLPVSTKFFDMRILG
jgi:hypothetical protein